MKEEFINEQSENLLKYFKARCRLQGMIDMPKLADIKIILKELGDIAEIEGNASDAMIQVIKTEEGIIVRPIVSIRREKENEDE